MWFKKGYLQTAWLIYKPVCHPSCTAYVNFQKQMMDCIPETEQREGKKEKLDTAGQQGIREKKKSKRSKGQHWTGMNCLT